jgi:hypothetical protein
MQILSKHLPNSYSPLHVFPHSEPLSPFSSFGDLTFTDCCLCMCSLLLMFTLVSCVMYIEWGSKWVSGTYFDMNVDFIRNILTSVAS